MEAAEKDYLLGLVRRLSRFYFVDVLEFCVMSNHVHWVGRVYPENHLSNEEIRERLKSWFPEDRVITDQDIGRFRTRWTSLSNFIKISSRDLLATTTTAITMKDSSGVHGSKV